MSPSRQLAAIMFTDIVGFTALMGSDEKKTFEILEKNRQIHKPIISTYHGRWIKELGDGVMASFSPVSYTHLDVYKRQGMKRFCARSLANR